MKNTCNSLEQLAFMAFMEAAPYIQHPDWVKEIFNKGIRKTGTPEEFMVFLEEEMVKQKDQIKKVDLKIYLTYVGKVWRKRFG